MQDAVIVQRPSSIFILMALLPISSLMDLTDGLDWDKVIKKTIVDMVESGEISAESMEKEGASEEEINAFFEKDYPGIKRAVEKFDK